MLTILIMAGGSGERFWPLSTKEKPKQLLTIFNEKSLIRLAFERVLPLVDKDRIFIATNEVQLKALKEDLIEVDDSRIIIEPAFKDTASAIGYGSMMISKYYDNPTICVLASDHLICDEEEFRKVIRIAELEAESASIVTLGIKPTYAETGYGYIEVNEAKVNIPTKAISFKEKPDSLTAEKYFQQGNYLWNSGMFIFKYSNLLLSFKKYAKKHYQIINELDEVIKENKGIETAHKIKSIFDKFEKISIDFAIMEKEDNINVIPSSFDWNDVGSFLAFDKLFAKDEYNNVVRNIKYVGIDSNNNIIIADSKKFNLSLLGVNNMIICVKDNNIMICEKSKNQLIKKLKAKQEANV